MLPDHAVELTTARLVLRAFRREDAEPVFEAVRESMRELGQWLSWCHPQYAIHDTVEFLNQRSGAFQADGEHGFAVFERRTGRFVGACGVNQLEKAALRANLGYWIRTSATGQGYAGDAAVAVALWAFDALCLERIEIVAATGNLSSQRVAERIGGTREGIARHRLRVHGVQHDAVVFSLIKSDRLVLSDLPTGQG